MAEDPILELITSVIPTDERDGTVIIGTNSAGGPLWGDPHILAALIRDKLTESGRLLPPGGEEQYRIVWSGQEGTYVDDEIDDLQHGLDHLAIIRGMPFVKEARLERRILTDWSPVVSDNSEGEQS